MVRHVLKITSLTKAEIEAVLAKAHDLKANPEKYAHALDRKTLLMLFQKPSLRTRVSFETGMCQMGGHAIFYSIADSPLGVKESFSDTGKVLSRMANIIMARVNKRTDVAQLAENSTIPVINALDDFAHPLQMLADMMAIQQHRKEGLKGLKMAYCGDLHNNVTYDLMRTAAIMGYEMRVAGPTGEGFDIEPEVLEECEQLCKTSGGKVLVCKTAVEAVEGVDVVYADSWMSYGIPKDQAEMRCQKFMPFQITTELLSHAKPDVIFMNCLPAMRGYEQTAEVIDGPHSIVFDEAENRLHTCKALMLFLLNAGGFEQPKGQRLLVALGGNALLQRGEKGSFEEASRNAVVTCKQLMKLIDQGHELVVTHGNGPQVGNIKLQNQIAADKVYDMPLHVCGAESQGYLGYLMQQTLDNVLTASGHKKTVVGVVTQTIVDIADPAFQNPTKPIGKFYTAEQAEELRKQGKTVVEDSGRGYRIVVPSPQPQVIVEGPAIKALVDAGCVVVSTGGGGIPVVREHNGELRGVEAVIDKDLGAAVLGAYVNADMLIILTDVECAYIHYQDPEKRQRVAHMTLAEAEKLSSEGEFAKGSMGPKVRAGMNFVRATGKKAIITSLYKVMEALEGKTGTLIEP